jgi:predicted 2-oxoglutarate/Fe(II)-dependent dioxygenase YbiX
MEKFIYPENMKEIVHRPDIVEYKNVLTKDECDFIINYWNSLDDWSLSCFYNSYVISGKKPNTPEGGPALRQIQLKSQDLAEKVFNAKLRQISLSAHRWDPGAFAADHADNAELDGTPNAWEENKFVTMIYLNDDFEGGLLTFRDHGLAFKPDTGSFIVFDVGIKNVHAVTEVTSGQRYTMLGSYDYADSSYNKNFQEIKNSIKSIQDEQKESWAEGKVMPSTTATMHEVIN